MCYARSINSYFSNNKNKNHQDNLFKTKDVMFHVCKWLNSLKYNEFYTNMLKVYNQIPIHLLQIQIYKNIIVVL